MKIAVMGAGAVGSYYGGMLARAGHEVVLVARPIHVAAIQRAGLRLHTTVFDEHVPVQASTHASAVAGADLVLVCVKSTDTVAAAVQLQPHLSPQAQVWSLQNGVDNAERLTQVLHRPVVPAVVYVATEMAGPGHVRHHGRGELLVGPHPGHAALQALFAQAGVPLQVSDNVQGALWAKLILNCAYNALSAISQQPYGVMLQGVGVPEVMNDVLEECLAVARAQGVVLPPDLRATVANIAVTMPQQRSSTAQDLQRGRPSEIDHLNGYILQRGQALGVPTPVNRVLHALVKLLEKPA